MAPRLKIRGIYTTALTRFFLDSGYEIADPSAEIQERFGLRQTQGLPMTLIQDREDLQGINIFAEAEQVSVLVRLLQERFLDAVLLECKTGEELPEELTEEPRESKDLARARLEFAGASKQNLDEIRCSVIPTLTRHHRLRISIRKNLKARKKSSRKARAGKRNWRERYFWRRFSCP